MWPLVSPVLFGSGESALLLKPSPVMMIVDDREQGRSPLRPPIRSVYPQGRLLLSAALPSRRYTSAERLKFVAGAEDSSQNRRSNSRVTHQGMAVVSPVANEGSPAPGSAGLSGGGGN